MELCASLKGWVTLADNLALINLMTEDGTATHAASGFKLGGGGGGGGGGRIGNRAWRIFNHVLCYIPL